MATIVFTKNEIISAINGSGIIERNGVKIEFNNCYIDEYGNPKIKAEINENLPKYYSKGKGGNIENGTGVSNYRYLKDYGTVKISCNNSLIIRVAGLNGADNHHIYNPSYKNINGINYKFVSSGVKDVTFLPTIDWIYGCKKDNIEYKTFWDDYLADSGEDIVHVDNRIIYTVRLGYNNITNSEMITINAGYIVETNVIAVDPSSYPYICRLTKIHGNVLPQQLNTDEEVYMLPVLALSVDETSDNQFYVSGVVTASSIANDTGSVIVVTDDTFEQIEGTSITVDALQGAELDIENNCYTRKIIAPKGTMFTEITIKTYFEDKLIDPLYKDNTRFIPQNQTFVSIKPTIASSGKLIREVTTSVKTESAIVDVVVDGTETTNSYEHTKTASEGKLLKEVKSIVNFEDKTLNVLETGKSYKDTNFNRYVRNPYTANGKLIRKVTPYVDIKNPTIKASDVLNGETINNTAGSLIDTIAFNGLTTPLTIDSSCIKDKRYELSDTKLIRYPIYMNIIKTNEAPDDPDSPEAIIDIMSIASIEKRDITFVEPRVPTVYYGIYIQLLQRMSKVAPELLKDCNCKCNSNINQKLINLWTMFHYACAVYMDDKNSKVAANIIKTIVSQLNIMYNDGEDWLKGKYYVGVYKEVNEPGEFEHISIYSLIPKEIDVCSERDLSYKLYHTDEVHYLILPPNIGLEKAWYEENGDIIILFDKEEGVNNYNIRYHKFDDFEEDYKVYWYEHPIIKNPINIKLNLINNK